MAASSVARSGGVAGGQEERHAQGGRQDDRRDGERQQEQRRGGEPQVQDGGPGGPPRGTARAARDHGRGDDDDPVAGQVRPPAQVEIGRGPCRAAVQPRVETAERLPQVPADEHPRAADREHVAAPVVLPLVDLVAVEPGDAQAERRGREPDVEQALVVVPRHLLAAGDPHRRRGLDLEQELLERPRHRRRVVREEPDPVDGGTHGGLGPG